MTPFAVRTITDAEAADRLGYSLRALRPVIDRHGLCLRLGRRRRLTEAHFLALQSALASPCRSSSTAARPGSTTYAGSSRDVP